MRSSWESIDARLGQTVNSLSFPTLLNMDLHLWSSVPFLSVLAGGRVCFGVFLKLICLPSSLSGEVACTVVLITYCSFYFSVLTLSRTHF